MLWKEFVRHQKALRAPLEEACDHLGKLQSQSEAFLRELVKERGDAESLDKELENLIGSDFGIPAKLLRAQLRTFLSTAVQMIDKLVSFQTNSKSLVRDSVELISVVGDRAEMLAPETLNAIIHVAVYGMAIADAIDGAPFLTITVLALKGLLTAEEVRKGAKIEERRAEALRQQLREQVIRELLEELPGSLTKLSRDLEKVERSFDKKYSSFVRVLKEWSNSARQLLNQSRA